MSDKIKCKSFEFISFKNITGFIAFNKNGESVGFDDVCKFIDDLEQENQRLKELLKEAYKDFKHISSKRYASCTLNGCSCCYDTADLFLIKPEVKEVLSE